MIMKNLHKTLLLLSLFSGPALPVLASETPDAQQLFKQKCALCHAMDKMKLGPAVNTMSSEAQTLRMVITTGRNSMPGYQGKLSDAQIGMLVDYLLANNNVH